MPKKARMSQMAEVLLPSRKPARQKAVITKTKVTYIISSDVLALLEEGQAKLRKMVDFKKRAKISRSLLVELALKAVFNDVLINGPDSQLYRDTESHLAGDTE
jgi:hypothetical protein